AYAETGVDAIFLTGIKDRAELDAISQAIGGLPIVLGAAPAAMKEISYLRERRVKVCLLGHQPFHCAVEAAYGALKALREGVKPADIAGTAPVERMAELTHKAEFSQLTESFLSSGRKSA